MGLLLTALQSYSQGCDIELSPPSKLHFLDPMSVYGKSDVSKHLRQITPDLAHSKIYLFVSPAVKVLIQVLQLVYSLPTCVPTLSSCHMDVRRQPFYHITQAWSTAITIRLPLRNASQSSLERMQIEMTRDQKQRETHSEKKGENSGGGQIDRYTYMIDLIIYGQKDRQRIAESIADRQTDR